MFVLSSGPVQHTLRTQQCSALRYLDMIVTDGVRDTFRKRSKVMSTIRHMLEQQDFLEVETPVLESTAGGILERSCLFCSE